MDDSKPGQTHVQLGTHLLTSEKTLSRAGESECLVQFVRSKLDLREVPMSTLRRSVQKLDINDEIGRRNLSHYFSGNRNPSDDKLLLILNVIGATPIEFYTARNNFEADLVTRTALRDNETTSPVPAKVYASNVQIVLRFIADLFGGRLSLRALLVSTTLANFYIMSAFILGWATVQGASGIGPTQFAAPLDSTGRYFISLWALVFLLGVLQAFKNAALIRESLLKTSSSILTRLRMNSHAALFGRLALTGSTISCGFSITQLLDRTEPTILAATLIVTAGVVLLSVFRFAHWFLLSLFMSYGLFLYSSGSGSVFVAYISAVILSALAGLTLAIGLSQVSFLRFVTSWTVPTCLTALLALLEPSISPPLLVGGACLLFSLLVWDSNATAKHTDMGEFLARSGLIWLFGAFMISFSLLGSDNWVGASSWALTFVALPLANGFHDWISWAASRTLISYISEEIDSAGLSASVFRNSLKHCFWDFFLALALTISTAWTIGFAIELTTILFTSSADGRPAVDDFLLEVGQDPGGFGFWTSIMILTSLAPTILHAAFVIFVCGVFLFQRGRVAVSLSGNSDPAKSDPLGSPLLLTIGIASCVLLLVIATLGIFEYFEVPRNLSDIARLGAETAWVLGSTN